MNKLRVGLLVLWVGMVIFILVMQVKTRRLQQSINKTLDHIEELQGRRPRPAFETLHCAVVHEDKAIGCPDGYDREKEPRFTEKDGSQEFACVSTDPEKAQCVDVLKAGETMEMTMVPGGCKTTGDNSPCISGAHGNVVITEH